MKFFLAALLIGVIGWTASAQLLCFPTTTLLDKGAPRAAYSNILQATLTPLVRGGEVYLPLRFVGLFLGEDVLVDSGWNTFSIGESTYRVGEKELHHSAPTIGGVNSTAIESFDVAPFLKGGRIYVPLKMMPWFGASTIKTLDGTLRLVAPKGCPAIPQRSSSHVTHIGSGR